MHTVILPMGCMIDIFQFPQFLRYCKRTCLELVLNLIFKVTLSYLNFYTDTAHLDYAGNKYFLSRTSLFNQLIYIGHGKCQSIPRALDIYELLEYYQKHGTSILQKLTTNNIIN